VIDGVKANSAAALADLQPGDRIIKIDGIANPTWEQVQPRVMISPNQPLALPFQRGDKVLEKPSSQAGDFVRSRLRRMVSRRTRHRWRG